MEKYLADAAPPSLRQSRPADYSCETAAPTVDDDKHHLSDGRLTPVAVHVHHELPPSLHSGTATLPDVKPFRAINSDVLDLHKDGACVTNADNSSSRDSVGSPWRQAMPPRAHNHNGLSSSSSDPLDITSPPPLPLSRGLSSSSMSRHESLPPASLLDRFRPPVTSLSGEDDRFSGLAAVNGLPPPSVGAAGSSIDCPRSSMSSVEGPVSMTARRPVTARNHHPGLMTNKPHRAIKCYHCRMCEQEFANKSDMQRHAKEAHRMEEKGHKCGQCLKTFPSSQQLTQHSLVHSNVRKYPCAYCDKAFKQLSHVQQHQRIHTGERPYQCQVDGCSKAFRQLSSLQQHLKGHNIPMPKSYPVCRAMPPPPQPSSTLASSSSGSPSSAHESAAGNKLNSSVARPHDLTCQVCEKHCVDEVRFFCHIHKYHPDYWRVFSGGRPLSDFIETTSPDSEPSSSPPRHPASPGPHTVTSQPGGGVGSREKRFSCSVCHKRYCNQTGYVKHMAGHPAGLVADAEGDDMARMALYNCVVCSKLFTKEAYLLRHMEMKLDPAHAVGLEQLKKSSTMFRTSTETTSATAQVTLGSSLDARSYVDQQQQHVSRSTSLDDDDPAVVAAVAAAAADDDERGGATSSPAGAGLTGNVMSARYVEDSRASDPLRRSTSCVSPLSTSSASPVSPPSFMPYTTAAEPRRGPPVAFISDADVLRRYTHPIASAAAAAAAAADYHLHRGGGVVDVVGYSHSPSSTPSSYRATQLPPPQAPSSHSPSVDDDAQVDSSPEADHDGRASYVGPERRRHDYYIGSASSFNRFQPYAGPSTGATLSSGVTVGQPFSSVSSSPYHRPHYSFYRAADDTPLPPPPPHLNDTYLRRSSTDLDERRPLHGFR